MTTIQFAAELLCFLCALTTTGAVLFLMLLCWIAKGSPDVNGDPERDGGIYTGPIDLHQIDRVHRNH